ncbi:uncharacterized protein UBRO_20657 [Ustilago bromivora]|uniref:Reverse transcriptase Ty1/copia-type domain-containing protein n=1 Tax=Ustilago bromivora TaxID=307758 RepID=A0A1K0H7B3_9BASI|nr:uncharacterized protein UBRO_20657 [Ustilago bromivora]SYW83795.1 uncharacterized protein UBRO2_05346 [Ustilago bromivora]
MWLSNHPVVSKHLHPRALQGTYLGFSNAPQTIKGHKVWLPELDQIVIAKDVRFSKFEQPETGTTPSHAPVLAGNNRLLHSYTWLPQTDDYSNMEPDEVTPPSLLQYSRQRNPGSQSIQLNNSSYGWEWDCLMAEIEAASETVVDIYVIATDLEAELDATPSERGNTMPDLPHTNALDTTPLLETPRSDAIADVYDNISMIEHGFTAFATTCSKTLATTISSHHIDHMAYAVTVMNRTTLITSSQQLQSADGVLLEPLLLNEAKLCNDWDKWQGAMTSEMASMSKMDVFELANNPADTKLIGVHWVFKLKLDTQRRATQYKARLVAQGYAQCQGLDYDQTFSLVVCLQTVCMLLTIARRYGLHITQLDVSTAFLNGKIDKDIYVRIPPMFETDETEGKCYRLKKALYGLKQAGRLWHAALGEQLQAGLLGTLRPEVARHDQCPIVSFRQHQGLV